MRPNAAMICNKFTDITDSYQFLHNEMMECSRDIETKANDLAMTIHDFKKMTDQMAQLNKSIK
jgi:hypothetical protein